jgi:DNA-binding GntR family transcriptional regulator
MTRARIRPHSTKPSSLDDIPALEARNNLSVEVAARVRAAILAGRFAPGERLREVKLATTLRVSRGPVREALTRLQDEGLVISARHRGASVARLSREDEAEVRTLRLALERLAIRLAVRNASEPDLRALEGLINRLKTGLAATITTQEIAAFEIEFHDRIYQLANHKRLYHTWAGLRSQIHIVHLSRNVDRPGMRRHLIARHLALVEAMRARDERAALRLVEEHVRGLGPSDLIPRLPADRQKGRPARPAARRKPAKGRT